MSFALQKTFAFFQQKFQCTCLICSRHIVNEFTSIRHPEPNDTLNNESVSPESIQSYYVNRAHSVFKQLPHSIEA